MNRKRRVDWFLLGMLGAAALAWSFPQPGARGGALHAELLNKLGVALIFLLHGLTLPLAALRAGALAYRLHLVVQLATFGAFPLVGWLSASLLGGGGIVSPSLAVGLFYLCALPSTVSSSVALTAAARGNVPVAVFNATLSSLLGVVLTPAWLGLVLGASGHTLPLGEVMLDLARWLLLPFALGQACRPLLGSWATRHKSKISIVDRLTILLLVYTSFCDSVMANVWQGSGLTALLVTLSFAVVLLGAMLGGLTWASRVLGFSSADSIAVVLCGSKKSLASGVPMARLIFGTNPGLSLILLPIMIYHPLQLVVGGWLAGRWARREGE
jgi:sodium/bile acid cotransporter 7